MRSFQEWLELVNEHTLSLGGVSLECLPVCYDYRHWWQTGCSPRWAARQALSMDNG